MGCQPGPRECPAPAARLPAPAARLNLPLRSGEGQLWRLGEKARQRKRGHHGWCVLTAGGPCCANWGFSLPAGAVGPADPRQSAPCARHLSHPTTLSLRRACRLVPAPAAALSATHCRPCCRRGGDACWQACVRLQPGLEDLLAGPEGQVRPTAAALAQSAFAGLLEAVAGAALPGQLGVACRVDGDGASRLAGTFGTPKCWQLR